MHNNFYSFCYWIHFSDTVENNVHRWNKNLPDTVSGKKIANNVEVFALPRFAVLISCLKGLLEFDFLKLGTYSHIIQFDHFQKQMSAELFLQVNFAF